MAIKHAKAISVIGAGPAGFLLAHALASKEMEVTIFDPRVPWDKPCAGLLPASAFDTFAILNDYPYPKCPIKKAKLLFPSGSKEVYPQAAQYVAISRKQLGSFLLQKVQAAGAKFLSQKVLQVSVEGAMWRVVTNQGVSFADVIVGADGANSLVRRRVIGKIPPSHLSICVGYFASGGYDDTTIVRRSLNNLMEYIWFSPGPQFASTGIIAQLGSMNVQELQKLLDNFLAEEFPYLVKLRRWVALVPTVTNPDFYVLPCAGKNWVLVGDSAGHTDPISGEGIIYALRSAELAAEAILEGDPSAYDSSWRTKYGAALAERSQLVIRD